MAQLVTLTRSDPHPRPGGANWQQWLAVHDAATGEPIVLLWEVMRPNGSIGYRDPATDRKLNGTLNQIIRGAMNLGQPRRR